MLLLLHPLVADPMLPLRLEPPLLHPLALVVRLYLAAAALPPLALATVQPYHLVAAVAPLLLVLVALLQPAVSLLQTRDLALAAQLRHSILSRKQKKAVLSSPF
jgi:CBS domain containing-hemolysin-like protein